MFSVEDEIRHLASNAQVIHALAGAATDEQLDWQPDPESWSIWRVVEHLYDEERCDFRLHLQELLQEPPLNWGELKREPACTQGYHQVVADLARERSASIAWLQSLGAPNWDAEVTISFGPWDDKMVLNAGDLLASWVEHDHLHIRQLNELLHAWHEQQVYPHKVDYAGGW